MKATFEALTPPFRNCYATALRIHEDLQGSVTASFTSQVCTQAAGMRVDLTGHDSDTCTVTIANAAGNPVAVYAYPPPTACCAEHTCQECSVSNTCNVVMGPQTQCGRAVITYVEDGGAPEHELDFSFESATADALSALLGGAKYLLTVTCGGTTIVSEQPESIFCAKPCG